MSTEATTPVTVRAHGTIIFTYLVCAEDEAAARRQASELFHKAEDAVIASGRTDVGGSVSIRPYKSS